MIDSQGRASSTIEGAQPSAASVRSPDDQYTFVDEAAATVRHVSESRVTTNAPKRGLKRSFEDLIKDESYSNLSSPEPNSDTSSLDLSQSGQEGLSKLFTTDSNEPSCSKVPKLELRDDPLSTGSSVRIREPNDSITPWSNSSLDSNNNSNETRSTIPTNTPSIRGSGRRGRSYGLRPRNNLRRSLDDRDSPERPGRKPSRRGRGRGAALSKYRRNTANARERDRMREINTAFATLRGVLPPSTCRRISSMTKITTLKLATSYIRDLANLLKDPPPEMNPNIPSMSAHFAHDPSASSSTNIPQGIQHMQQSQLQQHNQQQPHHHHPGISMLQCPQSSPQMHDACGTTNQNCGGGRIDHHSPSTGGSGSNNHPHQLLHPHHHSYSGGGHHLPTSGSGRVVEGRWWTTVENEVLEVLNTDIPWDDLSLSDLCWSAT